MIVFVDFDDTLLDTRALKREYFRALSPWGVSVALSRRAYEEAKKRFKKNEPRLHLQLIRETVPSLSPHIAQKAFQQVRKGARYYLFPDALPFLRQLRERGIQVELLTSGAVRGQKEKIRASGLSRFFHREHIVSTDEKKISVVGSYRKRGRNVVVIDDKPFVIAAMRRAFSHAYLIQLRRSHLIPLAREADAVAHSLHDAMRCIIRYGTAKKRKR